MEQKIANESEKPFVLIIDELNKFGIPLSTEASSMLKRMFLNPKNRYLVYSTHVPFDFEVNMLGSIPIGYKNVQFVPAHNLSELREMSTVCQSVSGVEAVLMGNIPSLISQTHSDIFKDRFVFGYSNFTKYICLADSLE